MPETLPQASGAPRVAVIGAGSSGIAALKALHERGLPVDCYERGDSVGGNWVFGGQGSACYASLHANTSRKRMQYADFPMPVDLPPFPHHSRVRDYFEAYVDHFGLRERIHFECAVQSAALREDGGWTLTLEDGSRHEYGALVVAHGHYSRPAMPRLPGRFDGKLLHSHDYREADIFAGRHVVVVGMGNSAMDIACDAARVARRVHLVARHGVHVVPKLLFGIPYDMLPNRAWIPLPLRRAIFGTLVRLAAGRPESHGLPRPDHRILSVHPTISADLLSRLSHGDIEIRPEIRELTGSGVRFADGTEVEAEVIVCCTGYEPEFPFLDSCLLDVRRPRLFKRLLAPHMPTLAFVGLLQPLGPVMPIAELQSRLLADLFTGRYAPPGAPAMERDIDRDRARHARRFRNDARHALEVDAEDYKRELVREHRRGCSRASRGATARFVGPDHMDPALHENAVRRHRSGGRLDHVGEEAR